MHTEVHDRIEQAQAELTLHSAGVNSSAIVDSLWTGLTTLRTLFLARLHQEIDSQFGADPIRAPKTLLNAKQEFRHAAQEIEIYSLVGPGWFIGGLVVAWFVVPLIVVAASRRYQADNSGLAARAVKCATERRQKY